MSDTTTLLHDYEVSRRLAEKMNNASLVMKRAKRAGGSLRSGDVSAETAATIARVLEMLKSSESCATAACPNEDIPQELIADLRDRFGAEMDYLKQDLGSAVESLRAGQISTDAINVIDKLCQSADSVASASFRRLRRR